MFIASRRPTPINFRGSVQLGFREPIYLKFEYVNQRIELHVSTDLHPHSLCDEGR